MAKQVQTEKEQPATAADVSASPLPDGIKIEDTLATSKPWDGIPSASLLLEPVIGTAAVVDEWKRNVWVELGEAIQNGLEQLQRFEPLIWTPAHTDDADVYRWLYFHEEFAHGLGELGYKVKIQGDDVYTVMANGGRIMSNADKLRQLVISL